MHVRPRQVEGKRDDEKEEIAEAMDEREKDDDAIAVGELEDEAESSSVFLSRSMTQVEGEGLRNGTQLTD